MRKIHNDAATSVGAFAKSADASRIRAIVRYRSVFDAAEDREDILKDDGISYPGVQAAWVIF